jgi:5-methylcytosine-specific restriction endonuclease McrA
MRMKLTDLSDDELVASLHDVRIAGRKLDGRLIVHLVEVEDRRLHLKAACSSLFDFCLRRLHMSEGAAFRRINASRLVRRFPSLLRHIESGAVHLSTLVLLRDHLAESNLEELVAATSGQTRREVEELLARRAPRPDVPSKIRKLPGALGERAGEAAPGPATASPGPLFGAAATASSSVAPRVPARIEPLSECRYKVQLTVSAEVREKLERAKDLMRHRNPSGDVAVLVVQALDALVEKLEKERLAKTRRPRRTARAAKGATTTTTTGRVPAAVRREVFARDGEQCAYVDAEGHRCASRAFLEVDHIESRALGGSGDAANLRVLCRAHNQLHAEEVFGRRYVQRRIHFRQRRSEIAHALPEALDAASRGLVRLGFSEQEVRRAVGVISRRHVEAPPIAELLRETLALLTAESSRVHAACTALPGSARVPGAR